MHERKHKLYIQIQYFFKFSNGSMRAISQIVIEQRVFHPHFQQISPVSVIAICHLANHLINLTISLILLIFHLLAYTCYHSHLTELYDSIDINVL